MDLKTALVDTLDPRPVRQATRYALGTLLEGIAVGLLLSVLFSEMSVGIRVGVAAACFLVGAILAVSAYSALKRGDKSSAAEVERDTH